LIELKGSHEGIRVVVSDEEANMAPEKLQQVLTDRLDSVGSFLAGARLTVHIARDALTVGVAEAVSSALESFPDMILLGIKCDLGADEKERPEATHGPKAGEPSPERMQQGCPNGGADWVDLHCGQVRGGQSIHSPRSLLLMGNVNPGARVSALGNVYVVGALKGVAHAGVNGKADAYIYAEKMTPLQLRIAGYVARNAQREQDIPSYPECAVVHEEAICVYPARRLLEVMGDEDLPAVGDIANLNLVENKEEPASDSKSQ